MNKKIILIDDDPINNLILRKELHKKDNTIELITFETASKAVDFIESSAEVPNFVLLDINMPEMNGWEFLEYLSRKKYNMIVFMITSSVVKRDQEKAKKYPLIKDYLIKPLGADDFNKIIQCVS